MAETQRANPLNLPMSASYNDPVVAVDELGREIRATRTGQRYLATDLTPNRPQATSGRGLGYNILDNIIGYDDGVDTPGERAGAAIGAIASDPIEAARGAVGGIGGLIQRLVGGTGTMGDVIDAASGLQGVSMAGVRPAGSLGMGGRVRASDLDPIGYQTTKLRGPLAETQVDARRLDIAPRTPRSWEETEGMFVIPFYGDRTAGQTELLGLNENQFSRPVLLEGGVDFKRGPANTTDRAIWASNSNITKRLQDTADRVAADNPDRQILGVTGSMAPNANDFATFTAETIAEMIPYSRVTSEGMRSFNQMMREVDPDFPGVQSDRLREWAATTTSPRRKAFIRLMETSPMQEAGFPEPGVGRYGVTDPTQRDFTSGQFGLGASVMDTNAPRLYNQPRGNQYAARVPHSTYNTQITGDYFGSLPPVPQGLLFRDLYDRMEGQTTRSGAPLTEAHRTHAIKTIVPAQEMTPRVIQGILDYLARGGQ